MNAFLASLAASVALATQAPSPASVNAIKAVRVESAATGATVVIAGSRAPTFTVFKLTDPVRLVIDLAGADISAVAAPTEGVGPVLGVTARQFANERASVGRVTVALAPQAQYEVAGQGDHVIVKVTAAVATAPAPAQVPAATSEQPAQPSAASAEEPSSPRPGAPTVETVEATAQPTTAPDVVKRSGDEKAVKRPAKALARIQVAQTGAEEARIAFATDGEVAKYEVLELANPPRLAVDLYGLAAAPKTVGVPHGVPMVREARVGKHDGKVRVVFDLTDAPESWVAKRTATGLAVKVGRSGAPAAGSALAVAPRSSSSLPSVRDIGFEGGEDGGVVSIALPSSVPYTRTARDPGTRVLTLKGVALPKKLERSLDTAAFGGPVHMVSAFPAPGERNACQVVAQVAGDVVDEVTPSPAGLHWSFVARDKALVADAEIDGKKVNLVAAAAPTATRASGFAAEAPTYAASGAPQAAKYTGRRVSFEFKDIDIHNLLRIIAEVSKKNIVVADDVSGKVTIRLRNVPWDQALDLVLKSKGLDKEVTGNIIRIAPLKSLEEERKLRLEARKAAEKVEPLKVRIIPVNYARAGDIADKVKGVLTERGEASVDQRTNVIIAKDTVEALARAEGLIRNLDTPTPQVLIEARIVEATTRFNRDVGIQWGGGVAFSPATGNPTGLAFPYSFAALGGSTAEAAGGIVAPSPNWAVNLPAAVGTSSGGAVGLTFGSAGGAVALNLRLSALEAQGHVKTISAPKVATIDNIEASISQGLSIPFSQVSAQGVNTVFVEAKLELKVTPHVTADGSVLMKITATNNQPDPSLTGANGQPSISKKEAKTEVLVKNGDTTVIGGIYTRVASSTEDGLPLFARIPVLGWLFKRTQESDRRTELLIFITPRIVNREQVASASESGT